MSGSAIYLATVWAIPVIIAITFHEAAHGFVAHLLGDDTAWWLGRVSFNPAKHIDPFGTIILPGILLLLRAPFLFGYAKPVPVNFRKLRSPRRDMVLVAVAGPAMNIALAVARHHGVGRVDQIGDPPIEALAASIKLARAGLREPEKPIGCYLFSGPTGVGKTEVAKQLAIGFDQGGLLTDGVDQHPHCVLLLDEIEKAHPDLFNVLLQIMDHGKLTDHSGKQVDFRNVILIMTTNAGASDMARAALGFTRTKREGDDMEAITRLFAPEFRNRLDAIITFAHLSPEIIKMVVEKFGLQLEAQLADRDVTIELSDEATQWLIANGYDELMGARPMARVIQEHIKKALAEEVLFGRLKGGGHVRVIVITDEAGNSKLCFDYPDGPVKPRPENLPKPRRAKAKRRSTPRRKPSGPRRNDTPPRGSSVPNVPLVKV
jgi:ATP-dependent Clp protease ATP-binding subunit ClpA